MLSLCFYYLGSHKMFIWNSRFPLHPNSRLWVKDWALRLLVSLKLANNPLSDWGHGRVMICFFSKEMDISPLPETRQLSELVRLASNSHRTENTEVHSFTYLYDFQYQECVIQVTRADYGYSRSSCYKKFKRVTLPLGLLFSTYWLAKFLFLVMPIFSVCYARQILR